MLAPGVGLHATLLVAYLLVLVGVGAWKARRIRSQVLELRARSGGAGRDIRRDAVAILEKLDLKDHLSPMRANGLFSMVDRIDQIESAHG